MWGYNIITVGALLQYSECSSVKLEDAKDRIVGGTEVKPPHKYPFQVPYLILGFNVENQNLTGTVHMEMCVCI